MFNKRRLLVFAVDVFLIAVAYVAAFLLRFDFSIPADQWAIFLKGLWIVLAIKPLVFLVSGLYRNLWRYASLHDAMEIFKVITISTVMAVFAIMYVRQFDDFPRSIFILDWFLLFSLVSASRLVWRIYREMYYLPLRASGSGKKTLIVGAGEAGSLLLKEMQIGRAHV